MTLASFGGLLVSFMVVSEMLRVGWSAYQKRKPGSILIGAGLLLFYVSQLLPALTAISLFDEMWLDWMFPGGMTCFVVGASLHLAREFVKTNRALRRANELIANSQRQLEAELQEAAGYVRSLLPAPVSSGSIQTSWVFQPSTRLGGDAFGYHWLDEDRFAIYLLDVCGHGVGSALLSVSALNTLRSEALPGIDFGDPAAVIAGLNRAFPMEAHHQQFFTVWYGVYESRSRTMHYSSAGHPPSWLVGDGHPPQAMRTPAPPVGCFADAQYVNRSISIPTRHTLYVVSDGVYELKSDDGTPTCLVDFEKELDARRWATPEGILDWARNRNGHRPLEDDFSVLRVQFD